MLSIPPRLSNAIIFIRLFSVQVIQILYQSSFHLSSVIFVPLSILQLISSSFIDPASMQHYFHPLVYKITIFYCRYTSTLLKSLLYKLAVLSPNFEYCSRSGSLGSFMYFLAHILNEIFFSLFIIVVIVAQNRRRSDVVAHWPLASLSTRACDLRTFLVALFCRCSHVAILLSCAHQTSHLSGQMRI